MTREPMREEVEAWANHLLAHPDVLEDPNVGQIAQLVAFSARVAAIRQRNALRVARSTLRQILADPAVELTPEQLLAARRLHLDGDPRREWAIASTSKSTFMRRRRRFGLVPWPPDYREIDTLTPLP